MNDDTRGPIQDEELILSSERRKTQLELVRQVQAMQSPGASSSLFKSMIKSENPEAAGPSEVDPGAAAAAVASVGVNDDLTRAIYQSPLWQAALRQQQLQLISHIASLNPFLHGNVSAAGGGAPPLTALPPAAAAAAAAAAAPTAPLTGLLTQLPPTLPNIPRSVPQALTTSMLPTRLESFNTSNPLENNAYRDYLNKLVQLQQEQNRISTTSNNDNSTTSTATTNEETKPITSNVKSETNVDTITGTVTTSNRTSVARKSSVGTNSSLHNNKDKVFTCKICNRSFGYKHVLQNHERTHTGEKPFECKVCHKRFTRDHHLKTHMRLHTGEKPYSCTHCERQFVQVANLRRHLRVHTGERPYKCEICSSCFSDSNQLKAHILIHKGEKPFSCESCKGTFRRRHHLMHHACPRPDLDFKGVKAEVSEDNGELHTALSNESGELLSEKRRKRKAKDPKKLFFPDKSDDEEETGPLNEQRHFQTEPEDLSSSKSKIHTMDTKFLCKEDV